MAANQWLSRLTNGHSLTVARLEEGPTVAANQGLSRPTKCRPLTVAHLGEGPTVAANGEGLLRVSGSPSLVTGLGT